MNFLRSLEIPQNIMNNSDKSESYLRYALFRAERDKYVPLKFS